MDKGREWGAAAASVAAASGIGFSSGRTIAMFFSQMGWASWLGVGTASVVFGALCGGACVLARRTGAKGLLGAYMRLLGLRFGRAVGVLHGLLLLLIAAVMLMTAGNLAALALPVRNAVWMGVLAALGISLLLSMRDMRGLIGFGLMTIAVCAAFYAGLALDPRPVRYYRRFETVAELSGSVPAAIVLAVLYAALSASVASGVAASRAGEIGRPGRFALLCGAGMLLMLLAANAALVRGGERLLSLPLPTVALAARWGTFGYYACILTMAMSATAALSAAVGALAGIGAGKT